MAEGCQIWIGVKRYDLDIQENTHADNDFEKCQLYMQPDASDGQVRQMLKDVFGIFDSDLILKLRNHRGSLVPISNHIKSNRKSQPYVLEVVHQYQNVHPMPRTLKENTSNAAMCRRLQEIFNRIENLDKALPELKNRRNSRLKKEMEDLNNKLQFLNKRFAEAESTTWQGMFRKNPMW